ncbi:MAG: hypothetical protein GX594_12900 [Pirellulaceae bacterium]|nr:hypothetical protein [Pirellulaceae bacterium]
MTEFALRASAALLLLAAFCPARGVAETNQTPLFTFVQLNDLHIDASTPSGYKLANAKAQYVVDSINAGTNFPLPNFVLGVGDMIHGDSYSALQPDFNAALPILNQLQVPFYPVMGNHENVQQEGNSTYEAPYRAAFGADRVNYTFNVGGMQFVVLNDSGAPSSNSTAAGAARRAWLQGVLEATPGVPKIIAAHVPLVPLRDPAVLSQSFGFDSFYARDAAMLSLLEQHSDDVVAVLSGHLHLTGAVEQNGIHHIVTSGLGSYPCDYAYYQVYSDHIHVEMFGLPDELTTPETNIHGPPRWGVSYTDSTHLTHEAYLRGNASERSFDIAISVPEPAVLTILLTGALVLLCLAWRNRNK